MAETEQGERTEQATDARREEFRKRGQIAHTRDLASALLLVFTSAMIFVLGKFFYTQIYEIFEASFGAEMLKSVRTGDYHDLIKLAAIKTVIMILPVLCVVAVIGVLSSVVQIGFLQLEEALTFDMEKINPLSGLQRLFSLRNFVEGVKAFLKLILIGTVMYFLLRRELMQIPLLTGYDIEQILIYLGTVLAKVLMSLGIVTGGIAAADYFFQRWDLEKKMMMSKQEIKEEVKQREGDPLIKARIRRIQREMANKRMMEAVPKADVIITNPTHIAVALKYDDNLPAPQLIAKGADLIAEKIKALAREHRIPVVENKPLARTIYKTLKLGQIIPKELFVAVAEVLSYVYKLKKKGRLT